MRAKKKSQIMKKLRNPKSMCVMTINLKQYKLKMNENFATVGCRVKFENLKKR